MTGEHTLRVAGVIAALLAGVGALLSSGDVEITLLMVAAVTTGLVCFDVSMERHLQAFGPWMLLSLAPVLKTVPEVWFQLQPAGEALPERYDHAGSLLFGVCVFGALVVLSRGAETLGSSVIGFDMAVILGSAATGALAGASVAFLLDAGFGSVTVGRILETPTWFVLAGILAAVVVAASHSPRMSFALTGLLATAATTSGVLATVVAGRQLDRGWWALLFAAFATSAVLDGGDVGLRSGRTRRSNASVGVALVVGLIAAASAIAARSDRTAWSPGWALLGVASLAMFGLAMASKPLDEQDRIRTPQGPLDIGFDDSRRARRARVRAIDALETGPIEGTSLPAGPLAGEDEPVSAAASPRPVAAPAASVKPSLPDRETPVNEASMAPTPVPEPVPAPANSGVPAGPPPSAPPSTPPDPAPVAPPQPQPVAADRPLSDSTLVASAQAAAAVRTAPKTQRHSLAPLAQAHHFDPSTGLLSSSGLQHAIVSAFEVKRRAGHVTILMFMIRDLDRIEGEHGRLASAAVTREVAERVNKLLPDGSGARFGRAAYAVVFVGDMSNAHETTQWLARVLLQLRAPVEGGTLGDKIDVVAGMAQCYESEDAASFITRANSGLARAVQLVEPTLVAMP